MGVLHRNINLSTTSELILDESPTRQYALLVNDSDTDCYLSLAIGAVVNAGIRVNKGGGSYEINALNLFKGRIYGVSSAATKRLMVTEIA